MPISGHKPATGHGSKDDIKFSDYLRMEKMRKFKRLPRLVG